MTNTEGCRRCYRIWIRFIRVWIRFGRIWIRQHPDLDPLAAGSRVLHELYNPVQALEEEVAEEYEEEVEEEGEKGEDSRT